MTWLFFMSSFSRSVNPRPGMTGMSNSNEKQGWGGAGSSMRLAYIAPNEFADCPPSGLLRRPARKSPLSDGQVPGGC